MLISLILSLSFILTSCVNNNELQQLRLKTATEMAWSKINYYYDQNKSGKISLHQAQKEAQDLLKKLRHGNNHFFFIIATDVKMIMHHNKKLEGKDLSHIKDIKGKKIFREIVSLCKKQNQGFIIYDWYNPQDKKNQKRVLYVKLFKPWNWIIGTSGFVK